MKKTLKPVFPPAAIEKEYEKRLKRLVREMEHSVVYWLRAKYRQNEDLILDSATDALQQAFRRLLRQWERNFRENADGLATWFAGKIRGYTARNLQAQLDTLRRGGLGFDLKFTYMSRKERQTFRAIVVENVNLIKSIASQTLTQVEGIVMRAIQNGFDLGTLTDRLHDQFGVTERRAAMIARDQTAKATNNLSRQRLMDYGITRGIWMHTSAGKTYRETHVEMDGTEYNIAEGCYDENEGRAIQPAELVNCHCVCRPVIPALGMEEIEAAMDASPFDESQHPRDERGRFAETGSAEGKNRGIINGMETIKTGTVGRGKGIVEVQLAFPMSKPNFASETATKGHDSHHANHAKEMGLNLRQWKQAAADLLNAKDSEEYLDWYSPQKDRYMRLEIKSKRLAIGDSDGRIRSFFVLKNHLQKIYLPDDYLAFLQKKG